VIRAIESDDLSPSTASRTRIKHQSANSRGACAGGTPKSQCHTGKTPEPPVVRRPMPVEKPFAGCLQGSKQSHVASSRPEVNQFWRCAQTSCVHVLSGPTFGPI